MFQIKVSSCGEKHDRYSEDKNNADFCIVFNPQDSQNAPSSYPALKVPILITNDSLISEESKAKKPFVNKLYVRSILVEYGKHSLI